MLYGMHAKRSESSNSSVCSPSSTAAAGADAVYGVPIVDEIEGRTKRRVARAAVYIALRRLELKGLVATWMAKPTQERAASRGAA